MEANAEVVEAAAAKEPNLTCIFIIHKNPASDFSEAGFSAIARKRPFFNAFLLFSMYFFGNYVDASNEMWYNTSKSNKEVYGKGG